MRGFNFKTPLLRPVSCFLVFFLVLIRGLVEMGAAQNSTNPTIDPNEARLVNAIFEKLRAPSPTRWNNSGELCSGLAIGDTNINTINPGLKCDCSYNNSSICHVTGLRIYAADVVGPIPDELWNLTYLTNIDMGLNYLTGPIPSSIGKLTRMQYMNFGINALSGELPKELGLLTDLRSLGIGTNNFSGPFPSELGNLTKLEQIYFDSSGISGVIPSTFNKLQNLTLVWGSDNQLTGPIPAFIGNWSKLTTLRFQGNSFEGPVPASFSNLTFLTDLRISDLSNGSSSLEFIKDMKSLSTLILRHNNISGSIPLNFGEYKSLLHLDLSFNNLNGIVPDSLFNHSSLTHVFLGNNKLTDSLPRQKSSNLTNIDLSYNQLTGTFPSWIGERNLQLNLVANNFTVFDTSTSLPFGLDCLQRNFPCRRGSPIYYQFAIKCGGPQIRSADGTVYERDNEVLGPASNFMTSTGRWAVSNVGLPADTDNPIYTSSSASQFTNTSDSKLFQTARLSAGSLRYYGLGLENGNYTVTLQFAESEIENATLSWRSLGRRVFDIYAQGNEVEKDFDIRRATGGRSLAAILVKFTALVTENYLEIHLFWAGKGTCCVPGQGVYGPSISAIRATPEFIPTVGDNPLKNKIGLMVGIIAPVAIVSFLTLFALCFFIQRRKRQQCIEDEVFLGLDARPYTFSYAELRGATNDFNPANKLGEGGFGPVYKGTLNDGRVIAVKQLSIASHQGKSQFVAEIATITAVQHRNLVKLFGCCIEGDKRLLVYEYLENKSLDQTLFGKNDIYLDWPTRFEICLGIARGLAYLHEESRVRIVHRDVKASNILLNSDLNPKISDFGLAKLYDDKKTHISTRVAGTIGYLAPEYALRGHLTEKADVFGFGVVALEIISGRPNSDQSQKEDKIYLLEWAWQLHETNPETELVDTNLSEFDEDGVKSVIAVALLCTQTSPALRPPMSRVIGMLTGDTEVTAVASRPGYLTDWKFKDATSFLSSGNPMSCDGSSNDISTTMVSDSNYSPQNASEPILRDWRW